MPKGNKRVQLKSKREDQGRPPIPVPLSSVTLPRLIDVETFIQARSLELSHFLTVLGDKAAVGGGSSTKLSFQLLPKHMRRRAMSHNSYRVPARIRARTEATAASKRPCRKRRRHTQYLLKAYERRNRRCKWLESHIWHAKRMKMTELWGYKIALYPNDKGVRAMYRFVRDDCGIYDSSYYAVFKVKNLDKLNEMLRGGRARKGYVRECCIYREDIVCPVEVIYYEDYAVVIVHPMGAEEVQELFKEKEVEFEDMRDMFNIYKLRGPRSTQVLVDALQILTASVKEILELSQKFSVGGMFNDGCVMAFEMVKPKLNGPIKSSARLHKEILKGDSIIPETPPVELLRTLVNWPVELSNTDIWESENLTTVHTPLSITTRTRRSNYPKPRSPSKPQSEVIPEVQPSAESDSMEIEPNQSELPTSDSMDIDTSTPAKTLSAILIYKKSPLQSGFGQGWDLIFPSSNHPLVWRKLIFANAKAMGLREYQSLLWEQGRPYYPNDYPTTKAYNATMQDYAQQKIEQYFRRPPNKRLGFERIGMPYPYISDWDYLFGAPSYQDLLRVSIKARSRCPKHFALICRPEAQDLFPSSGPAHTEPLHEKSKPNKDFSIFDLQSLPSSISISREIIGFVTSGGYSFTNSRGFGTGYIHKRYSEIFKDGTALFRNTQSRFYHICRIKQISNI